MGTGITACPSDKAQIQIGLEGSWDVRLQNGIEHDAWGRYFAQQT